jgi:hypothetical protein
MPGGDGDQAFFARLRIQGLTEPNRFPGKISGWEGLGLFIIEGGEFSGEHVALSTKSVTGIADQISRRGSEAS